MPAGRGAAATEACETRLPVSSRRNRAGGLFDGGSQNHRVMQHEPHATPPYPMRQRGKRAQSYFRLLNGTWHFHAPSPHSALVAYAPVRRGFMGQHEVPGNWHRRARRPIYVNVRYPFPIDRYPLVPEGDNLTGSYRRTFRVPEDWRGWQVFVLFRGRRFCLLRMGQRRAAGYSQDSRRQPINITRYLKRARTCSPCRSTAGRMAAIWRTGLLAVERHLP
jgi:hypothetical protein